MKSTAYAVSIAMLVSACAAPAGTGGVEPLSVVHEPADAELAPTLTEFSREAWSDIETFFGHPFLLPAEVSVLPDRPAFDRYAQENWGMSQTACWMVGAAHTRGLILVSPRTWSAECEHDPEDLEHVRGIVAHELVHTFHMQYNPSDEFAGAEEVGWFAEGVATYVSGQLRTSHGRRAREAIETGAAPARLVDAWSGPFRYGVAGSLAAFIDHSVGRDAFFALLAATTQQELLAPLGMTESEALEAWEAWVMAR